ncbi:MAG: Hsp20/alpha crystallin family protein [Verrucomicrobiota bacterium]|jgi:HSP20 family protein
MNAMCQTEKNQATAPARIEYVAPEVDILETKEDYLLQADMPGVAKADLELLIEGNELTIVGRRQRPVTGEVLVSEIELRDYRRSFVLDPQIATDRITAQLDQGVLTVHLPKAEAVKPRKIAITD